MILAEFPHNVFAKIYSVLDGVKTVDDPDADDDIDDPNDARDTAANHQLHDGPRQHRVLQGQGQEAAGGGGECTVGGSQVIIY